MPLKCTFRPNRTSARHFNAKAVGRIFCNALLNGVPEAEMQAEFRKCELGGNREKDKSAAEAIAEAIATLEANQELIAGEQDMLANMLRLLNILAALGRFIIKIPLPQAKIVGGLAVILRETVANRVKALAVQRAANDATIKILQRAAANEAAFLRTVGL